MTSISRIVKIGDTDISSYVEWGPRRAKGAGRKMNTSPIIGSNRAVVWQEGRDPLTLSAGLIFRPDLTDQIGEADDVTALIDDLSGDQETDRLYFGRADRFAVVYGSVGDTEIAPAAGGGGIVRKTAEFWAEAAELYAATPTAWDDDGELPLTMAEAIENSGNIEACLYSLEVEAGAETALKFDGSNDYVTHSAVDLSGTGLTVMLRFNQVNPGAVTKGYWNQDYAQLDNVLLIGHSAGSTVRAYIGRTGETAQTKDFGPPVYGEIVTYHFTYDVTGNAVKCFKNGVQFGTTWTPSPALSALLNRTIELGRFTGSNYFGGVWYKHQVWKRVLTDAEIADDAADIAVDDTGLVICQDFSEGEGDTLTDLSGEGNDGTLTNFADTSAGAGDSGDSGWMMDRPEAVVLEMLDDEDAVVASIALSPALLSAEVLEVDRFGQIRQTYADGYDSGVRFGYDGFEDGTVAVADGSLVIETSSYAGYALVGQWPLKKGGLLVTFTPTEAGTGEALLEVSVDGGGSWLEVSNNSRWVDGAENEIYVPQAEGYVEVWIRWRCDDAITSLSIDDLKIVQLRAVSGADVPKIPAGEERVLQVSGAGRAIISAEYRDRYKP